ncbi:MAG: AI-2E family transporter [Candidatus Aceula meridiana]|nr:AI-2E family transporter [Candidatus Aceula meridiana]
METSPREHRVLLSCLVILTAIAVAFSLAWLRPMMVPFVLAIFVVLMLTPAIDFQRRFLKIPHPLAVLITFFLGVIIVFVFYLLISSSIVQIAPYVDSYDSRIKDVLGKLMTTLPLEKLGIDGQSLLSPIVENATKTAGFVVKSILSVILGILSSTVLVLIFVLFLLLGRPSRSHQNETWQKGEAKIKHYISTKFFLSVFLGIMVGSILKLLGVDMALIFGVAAFILNFIPTIGPVIATLLPLPVVMFNSNISLAAGVSAIVIPGILQFIFGNVVEPKILGDSLDIHPVVVLMALIFWGMLWGILGMFLAIPLTAVIKLILEEFDQTKPIANLMAGHLS